MTMRVPDLTPIRSGVVACLLLLTACGESPTESPTVDAAVQFAKGGNGNGPSVNAADPALAPQDLTLDVRVLGSGFDRGSSAKWLLQQNPTADVVTNSTEYVSASELLANITIAADAQIELAYDIEVTTRRGKKGVGVELFKVEEKTNGGGPPAPEATPITITMTGGMIASPTGGVANGQYGTNTEELLMLRGEPAGVDTGGCTTATDPNCFWDELALDAGVQAAGGYAQCVGHRKQTAEDRAKLLSKLDSPLQARWIFWLESFDRVARTARIRNVWHEEDNPDRYTFFLDTDGVVETGGPGESSWELLFTNGVIRLYGTGDKALTCNWQGTITLAIGEPTS